MTVSTLKKKLVLQAIEALRQINQKHYEDSSKKKPLLQEEGKSTLYIQVMLKKIPKSKLTKMIKVNLPHSLVKDSDEVCLITGDLDKKNHKAEIEPDVLHYKTILEKHGITQVSQVITLRQLRTEYKPYEAKQKLLAAFDVFLADNKIAECLPRVLGKHFLKKRKFPIQINLRTSNLKQQVEKALSVKTFYITGHGNSCTSEVACLDMADSEILDNILAMADALSKNVPGTWSNIMGIYLKTAKSKAVPVYVSYDSPNDIQLPKEKEEDDALIDELNTIPNVKVKVYSSGKVETLYEREDMETSFTETQENDTEKSNVNSELPNMKNECSDEEEFETEVTRNEENKKIALKRKRIKSESTILDSEQTINDNATPVKPTKKRKIEGVNMKKYQAMKESKKSKRKNHQKTK